MLHISFFQLTSKRHVIVNETSISLPIGKAVLLQGNKETISIMFTHILYQNQCQFTLENELLDKDLLKDNIILLTSDGVLPLMKKVKTLFSELGYDQAQCVNFLRRIDLESKANWHISRLSKEERLLLSVQLACASQVSILLLDKDWTKLSVSCQNKITNLLEMYLTEGNFSLINQGAKHLIPCDEQYEMIGQDIHGKQEHVSNFLEEKGRIDSVLARKQTIWKRMKKRLSILSICGNALYCALSVLFVSLALFDLFGFSLAIQQLDTNIERVKSRGHFRLDVRVCSREYRPEEYCDDTMLSSNQLALLNSFNEIDRVYPIHSIYIASKGWLQNDANNTAGFYVDGESIAQAMDGGIPLSSIEAFDASLFKMEETFADINDTTVGVYASKEMIENNKEFFDDVLDKKMSIRGSFEIPIYSQTVDNSKYSEFNVDSNRLDVWALPVKVELDLPVLGIVEGDGYTWYMDEQVFYKLQKEAIQKYPKDSSELYTMDTNVPIDDYQATDYQVLVDSYDELVSIEDKLKILEPKIRIDNSVVFMQQNKQAYVDSQVQLRNTLTPNLIFFGLLLGVCIAVLYRFQKFDFLYKFQHQRINRKWKLHILRDIVVICLLISALSFLAISALSSISFQDMLISSIMNSSYANSQNMYDNSTFSLLNTVFQVLPMYSKSLNVLFVILLFSSCVAILRYASTLYCYMKSHKQL